MRGRWGLQEAKRRFTQLIRSAEAEGPQFVTRHGEEVAVVLSMPDYTHLLRGGPGFKQFVRSAPDVNLDLTRSARPARRVELERE